MARLVYCYRRTFAIGHRSAGHWHYRSQAGHPQFHSRRRGELVRQDSVPIGMRSGPLPEAGASRSAAYRHCNACGETAEPAIRPAGRRPVRAAYPVSACSILALGNTITNNTQPRPCTLTGTQRPVVALEVATSDLSLGASSEESFSLAFLELRGSSTEGAKPGRPSNALAVATSTTMTSLRVTRLTRMPT